MIPSFPPPPGPGYRAETLLFDALASGLDDGYFVYNRLKYVEPRGAAEGECDFLILHRERGMLIVECKGGGVRRAGDGRWLRQLDGTEQELDETPFAQAQRTVKQLIRLLEPRTMRLFERLDRLPFVHGHAVAFPRALRAEANLPLDVDPETIWDADDLGGIGARVEAAFAFWRRAARGAVQPLEPWEFKQFRKKVLHPQLHVVASLGAAIRGEEHALVRLSTEQLQLVDSWIDNRRIRVCGGAGTGKTILALEAARRLAEQGDGVYLLCFNRPLKDHLRAAVEQLDVESGRLQVANFHGLCRQAHSMTRGQDFAVPGDAAAVQRFWTDEAPCFLLDAIAAGHLRRADALIVDEGQDFAEPWWPVLEELLGGAGQGRMIVFYDPQQTVFGRACCVPAAPTITLRRNFRNTRRIAAVVNALGELTMESFDRCPDGEAPDVRPQESPSRTRKQLANLVARLIKDEQLLPDQIALLSPHTRKNSALGNIDELAGYALAGNPLERDGKLLHTTIGRFKGLESDVVIMFDVDPDDPRCDRHARYVAASRARHRLYVFAKGDWLA
jgi:hypothetical protein